jgi:hypothetical protein
VKSPECFNFNYESETSKFRSLDPTNDGQGAPTELLMLGKP